jgi:DNA-formamidopyrimidine glycosylase
MPELIEVLVTGQYLNLKISNKIITKINILGGRYKRHKNSLKRFNLVKSLLPLKIISVNTKGKFLWFELINNNKKKIFLMNTFGMSGKWSFKKEKHSNIEIIFKNKNKIYFTDVRNFGTIKFDSKKELDKKLNCLGPDLLQEKINSNIIKKRFFNLIKKFPKKKNKEIVKVLMNQTNKNGIGSGIGNYLAPEILYRAKISPHTKIIDIYNDDKLIKKLTKYIKYVLKLAYIKNEIGYMINLIDFSSKHQKLIKKGKLPNYYPKVKLNEDEFDFLVYGQNEDPYGNTIKKDKIIKGRTTYWVPNVQI